MSPRPVRRPRTDTPDYVDTPAGIVSAGGVQYHTTEALLREFAGPVLDRTTVGALVRGADAWTEAPRAVAAMVLLAALAAFSVPTAVGLALTAWVAVALVGPGMATPLGVPALRVGASAGVQGLVYALGLSAYAAAGMMPAVWTGLAAFVLLRLGVVGRLLAPVLAPVLDRLYALPPPDQMLRSLVVRTAIRDGVSLPVLADAEARVRAFWKRDG